MAKNTFPWVRRQMVKLLCRVEFNAGRSEVIRAIFAIWQKRLLRRYERSLHGKFPREVKTAVLFLSCDEEYFRKFGIHLVRSGLQKAGELNVHLHLNKLSEAYWRELQKFAEGEGGGLFSFTWDDIEFADLSGDQRWYYLASVRFIRLYQLVSICNAPVLSVDADGVVVKSLGPKLNELQGVDAGIYLRLGNTLDWRKVLASAFCIMPTMLGRRYMRDVALMIAWLLQGKLPYHIDQLVIYYMWQIYSRRESGFRVAELSQDMADWECHPESYLWSAKGDRKYLDKAFQEAQVV